MKVRDGEAEWNLKVSFEVEENVAKQLCLGESCCSDEAGKTVEGCRKFAVRAFAGGASVKRFPNPVANGCCEATGTGWFSITFC